MARNSTTVVTPARGAGAFQRLKSLACFPEVHTRIVSGAPITALRDYIREDQGELLDLKPDTLLRLLYDYRASLPAGLRLAGANPQAMQAVADRVADGLDELEELQKLYAIQLRRVERAVALEADNNTLYRTTVKEIETASTLLVQRAKLKQDLGISPKQLGDLNVNVSGSIEPGEYGNPLVAQVLSSKESVHAVTSLVERMLHLAAQSEDGVTVVDLEPEAPDAG